MLVVDSVASEVVIAPEPRELLLVAHRFLPAILVPLDVGSGVQDAGTFLAAGEVLGHEGTDIEAYAVVDVWFPTDCLFFYRLPADEEIKRRLACEDGVEPLL